jgi:formate dehydrogenase iron-sulfur subunit
MSAVATVYVPRDSSARAVGADEVADAIAAEAKRRGLPLRIVRNGSRGLAWLEPLVECAAASGRIGFGPVQPQDVAALFDAGFPDPAALHPLSIGPVEQLPYLKSQQRLTFARIGLTDPVSVEDYVGHEGFAGLRRALQMPPEAIVNEVTASGLRGRGGAAFPTGI